MGFRGKAYDVTGYLEKHPGGADAITPYRGTSEGFEQAFLGKHGTGKIEALGKMGVHKGALG